METKDIRLQTDVGDSSLRTLGGLTIQPIRLDLANQTRSGADIYLTRLTGKLSLETVHVRFVQICERMQFTSSRS